MRDKYGRKQQTTIAWSSRVALYVIPLCAPEIQSANESLWARHDITVALYESLKVTDRLRLQLTALAVVLVI